MDIFHWVSMNPIIFSYTSFLNSVFITIIKHQTSTVWLQSESFSVDISLRSHPLHS